MNEKLPDIRQVLRDYTSVEVPSSGSNFECPFHQDTSKNSMKFYPESNTLHCFGSCSKSYSPINVVSEVKGISQKAAYEELQKKYDIKPKSAEEEKQIYILRIFNKIAEESMHNLTDLHRNILNERGLTDDSIKKYKIGYISEDIFSFKSVTEEEFIEAGIVNVIGNDSMASNFADKIVVPIYSENNELVTIAAWNFKNIEGEPKYAYPKDFKKPIAGNMSNGAYLVEGVFDLIIMQQQGFKAFSFLGVKATKEQMKSIKGVKDIKILLDADEAGIKQANKLACELYPNAVIVDLPVGHDPNSYYIELRSKFNVAIQNLTDKADDLVDKKIDQFNSMESREAAKFLSSDIVPLIAKLEKAEQEVVISDIVKNKGKIGFTKAVIRDELKAFNVDNKTKNEAEGTNLTTSLYESLKDKISLYKDKAQVVYARVPIDNHSEILAVNGEHFKKYLRRQAKEEFGKIVSVDVINGVKASLEADGYFEGQKVELENRVKKEGDAFYYDLSDEECRVIKVTSEKWIILNHHEPLFIRQTHQIPQVDPNQSGDIKEILTLFPRLSFNQQLLYQVFLVYCLVPSVPKIIMYVQGEKGSGKSDFTKITRQLIDPSVIESLKEPRIEDRAMQQLEHHYVALFDNVNVMHDWFVRLCCTAVTGESDEKRQLFTDDGTVIFNFKRAIIINAINRLGINFPDFQDRIQLFKMERILPNERMEREEFWIKFNEMKSRVLGGMFNTLSKAMKIRPTIQLDEKPRMADYAVWGCAISEALGYTKEKFLNAYHENMEEANHETIENHPIAYAISQFMMTNSQWKGNATELLELLDDIAVELHIDTKQRIWPKSPSSLSMRLNEISSNLLDVGIKLVRDKETGTNSSRFIELAKVNINSEKENLELESDKKDTLVEGTI